MPLILTRCAVVHCVQHYVESLDLESIGLQRCFQVHGTVMQQLARLRSLRVHADLAGKDRVLAVQT